MVQCSAKLIFASFPPSQATGPAAWHRGEGADGPPVPQQHLPVRAGGQVTGLYAGYLVPHRQVCGQNCRLH